MFREDFLISSLLFFFFFWPPSQNNIQPTPCQQSLKSLSDVVSVFFWLKTSWVSGISLKQSTGIKISNV